MIDIERKGVRLQVVDEDATAHWKFWARYMNKWGAAILDVIDQKLPDDGKLIDIGAWVGPMTLWAAQRADVIAVEPDPVACDQLRRNVEVNGLNDRVTIIEAAASDSNDDLQLHTVSVWGRSHSSMTRKSNDHPLIVSGIDSAALVEREKPDLVKMDIEGGEAVVVPAMGPVLRELGIPLLISMHPNFYHDGKMMDAELEHWNREPVGTTRVDGKEWLYTPR